MKPVYYFGICAITAQILTAGICHAQTTNLKPAPANVAIDGSAAEWTEFTPYASGDAKINYAISNDKDNLYLVIKTQDILQQNDILNNGVTFSVDIKGRKRSTYAVTYPKAGVGKGSMVMNKMQAQTAIEADKRKKIKAEGFKDIKDEEIDYSNTYNIKAAMGYDTEGNLVYEEAIPLALFNAGEQADKQWAFNIQINRSSGQDNARSMATRIVVVSTVRASSGGISSSTGSSFGGSPGSISSGSISSNGIPGASASVNRAMVSGNDNNYANRPGSAAINFWIKSPLAKQ